MTSFDFAHRFDRKTVFLATDHQAVDARFNQLVGALAEIAGGPNCGRNSQPAQIVFGSGGILDRF
jgi:hypothetical protein